MAKDYLFEIGTEEMPAHVVTRSVNQLADRTRKYVYSYVYSKKKMTVNL